MITYYALQLQKYTSNWRSINMEKKFVGAEQPKTALEALIICNALFYLYLFILKKYYKPTFNLCARPWNFYI